MRALRLVAILFTGFLAAGAPARAEYLSQQELMGVRGDYVQAASGMVFPPAVGGFQRESIVRYDTDETDVSAGYNLEGDAGRIVATVYVYLAPPAPSSADDPTAPCLDEFKARIAEVMQFHAGSRFLGAYETALDQGGVSHPGYLAGFELGTPGDPRHPTLFSELHLFCDVGGRWIVKYRFTFPKDFERHQETIRGFMEALRWTIREGM